MPENSAASAARKVAYEMRTNKTVSKLLKSFILVNFVKIAFTMPNKLPIAKEPRNIPKKLAHALKKFPAEKLS